MPQVDVTWVNTIGMRTPRLDLATARRVGGKIRSILQPSSKTRQAATLDTRIQPRVLNPAMWPWFTRAHDRWLNKRLLGRRLRSELKAGSESCIAITTIPVVADLVGNLPVQRWVYYCVDDFSVWPGLDQGTMLRMERDLIAKVDQVVAVSEVLQERIQSLGRDSTLLTHGVHLEDWNLEKAIPCRWPTEVAGPVALFWGVVDRRLDTEFVLELSRKMDRGSIVFVGPQQDPDPRLAACRNVFLLPAVDAAELPSMARAAKCLIMPYANSPVTQAMQPLKLKEYLATGKPIVARRLPATEAWHDACDLVDNPQDFALQVDRYLRDGMLSAGQLNARTRLAAEGWPSKAADFYAQITSSTTPLTLTAHLT